MRRCLPLHTHSRFSLCLGTIYLLNLPYILYPCVCYALLAAAPARSVLASAAPALTWAMLRPPRRSLCVVCSALPALPDLSHSCPVASPRLPCQHARLLVCNKHCKLTTPWQASGMCCAGQDTAGARLPGGGTMLPHLCLAYHGCTNPLQPNAKHQESRTGAAECAQQRPATAVAVHLRLLAAMAREPCIKQGRLQVVPSPTACNRAAQAACGSCPCPGVPHPAGWPLVSDLQLMRRL